MALDPHIAIAALCGGIGCIMALGGVQKSALEWRRKRRTCPSCGRQLQRRVCPCSSPG